ncbi:MAG: cytochrome c [Deltaproteobacteria bacterium]|nr:cytochrome c [Deltaproteobacteria bacterium]
MRVLLGLGASLIILSAASAGVAADDAAAKVAAADAASGAKVYKMYCETCHGPTGAGDGAVGKTLTPPPRNFQAGDFKYGGKDQDLFDVISNGAASKGGSPLMAPWGAVVPEADRWALVKFIHTLKK